MHKEINVTFAFLIPKSFVLQVIPAPKCLVIKKSLGESVSFFIRCSFEKGQANIEKQTCSESQN